MNTMFEEEVSMFDNEKSDEPVVTMRLSDIFFDAKGSDKNMADCEKPGATVSGIFANRRDDAPKEYSGYIAVDFLNSDNNNNPTMVALVLQYAECVAALLRNSTKTTALIALAYPKLWKPQVNALKKMLEVSGLRVDEESLDIHHLTYIDYDEYTILHDAPRRFDEIIDTPQVEPKRGQADVARQGESNKERFTITPSLIEQVKQQVRLADVVMETVPLRQAAGGRLVGCCPFHTDKTASFTVYSDGHYFCYGCQKGGDVITYIQTRDHLSFFEAVKKLAGRVGGMSAGDESTYLRAAELRRKAMLEKEAKVEFIDPRYVARSRGESVFTDFLQTLFDLDTVKAVSSLYQLGTTRNRETIFWQIDREGRVRQGKIVPYKLNGHRDKDKSKHIDSVAFRLRMKNFSQCLFGENQLTNTDKPIALVEAEKTAVICAALLPQYTWVATGGKGNFKEKMLYALRGKAVTVFPDYDAYDLWREKATEIDGVTFSFSGILRDLDFPDIDHADIADVLVSLLQQKEIQPKTQNSGDPAIDVMQLCRKYRKQE